MPAAKSSLAEGDEMFSHADRRPTAAAEGGSNVDRLDLAGLEELAPDPCEHDLSLRRARGPDGLGETADKYCRVGTTGRSPKQSWAAVGSRTNAIPCAEASFPRLAGLRPERPELAACQ